MWVVSEYVYLLSELGLYFGRHFCELSLKPAAGNNMHTMSGATSSYPLYWRTSEMVLLFPPFHLLSPALPLLVLRGATAHLGR